MKPIRIDIPGIEPEVLERLNTLQALTCQSEAHAADALAKWIGPLAEHGQIVRDGYGNETPFRGFLAHDGPPKLWLAIGGHWVVSAPEYLPGHQGGYRAYSIIANPFSGGAPRANIVKIAENLGKAVEGLAQRIPERLASLQQRAAAAAEILKAVRS